jgi:hypothetical protein
MGDGSGTADSNISRLKRLECGNRRIRQVAQFM